MRLRGRRKAPTAALSEPLPRQEIPFADAGRTERILNVGCVGRFRFFCDTHLERRLTVAALDESDGDLAFGRVEGRVGAGEVPSL